MTVDIDGAVNVADAWCAEHDGPTGWAVETWLDDGYTFHSPVGLYRANPFGLHDTAGNLWEWTADAIGTYTDPVRPGDGLRLVRRQRRAIGLVDGEVGPSLDASHGIEPGIVGDVGRLAGPRRDRPRAWHDPHHSRGGARGFANRVGSIGQQCVENRALPIVEIASGVASPQSTRHSYATLPLGAASARGGSTAGQGTPPASSSSVLVR